MGGGCSGTEGEVFFVEEGEGVVVEGVGRWKGWEGVVVGLRDVFFFWVTRRLLRRRGGGGGKDFQDVEGF